MKIKYIAILMPALLFGNNLLNSLKQKEFEYDKKYTIQDSKDTEKSWINPLLLQYSYSKDNSLGDIKTTSKVFSITVNQPVFKSGAIYYSIKYAKNMKTYNINNINIQRRSLIKQALDLAYDYKISMLNKKIINLNIQNTKIDINKKKEEFLNGVGDSSLLNNAILNLNSLKLSLQDLNMNMDTIKYSFADISSLKIQNVVLPKFRLISRKKFINSNLDLLQQKQFKKIKYDLYKMQLGNQLLNVSLNGSLNWQNIDYSQNSPQYQNYKSNYYTVGFSVTLPISFNAMNKIQKTKIDYMKSQLLIQDMKLQLANQYKSVIRQIDSINKKIKIYKDNIKIYNSLIASTIDSIKAGNATKLDLKIMQNSRETMFINIEMLKLKKQKLLLSLYYKSADWKN